MSFWGAQKPPRMHATACVSVAYALQTLGLPAGVPVSCISQGLPLSYHRRVAGTKSTTSAALAHPRATGRRPRLLHLSGSPLVSTSGAWLGQCLPPRRPLGCKAILTSSARFVNPRRPSGKMHKISLSIQATLAKSPFIWKARLTFPSCRAILHPWKANFPRKEAAR